MFMTPVISGSTRVNNDTFGLMPLNALNGSDSPQPIQADFSSSGTVPPSYEEALSSVLCGSLAFEANRDSLNPSPSTPRSRKLGDSSPRSFKMSPTPSRVAPVTLAEEEDVMVRLANEQNAYHTSMTIPHIQEVKKEDNENMSIFHRSNSDPPPSYDDVIHMSRDVTSCPEFQLQQGVEYSVASGNISIISASGVNGLVLSDLEQSAQLASSKSRKKRRMRHTMCGCVIVLLVVAVSVLIVLMTSGSLLANHEDDQRTTTPLPTSKADRSVRSLYHLPGYHVHVSGETLN